jgi:hypothetical protein
MLNGLESSTAGPAPLLDLVEVATVGLVLILAMARDAGLIRPWEAMGR